ncbi:spore coat protein CotJB [Sporolactobacillus inulinus]|uniref:CotJB protein n=1 Tax=Sporolactobacillus inulinus CASD TaxID=1069536 RepID=A0A0U1QLJ1_9BACL|nr:spore coat protein CotJB [Sporolactobacillus inulinus]KLI01642.1 cotJB protein [Sporolactobacillus inulinus CASD]GEB76171.1 spore coat protein CotJB [Sporolactobacillus inulinus]
MADSTPVPESYYPDLKALQAIDFTLVELNLYLDTHPNDLEALKQFNSAVKKSAEIRESFEARYGPLQNFGHSLSAYPWKWKDTPWPWQV